MKFLRAFFLIPILVFAQPAASQEVIKLDVGHGTVNDALFYSGTSPKAAVLAHQSGKTMESWRDLALVLRKLGYASVSPARSTKEDVIAAADYLREKGYGELVLIGASVGGGAISQALETGKLSGVHKVVLMAPSIGAGLETGDFAKLVMVAKMDFNRGAAYRAFEDAAEPKFLKKYNGVDHGQYLLEGEHAKNALKDLIDFLAPH